MNLSKGLLFSTYAKFSEKVAHRTPWYVHVRLLFSFVSFSENFAYVLKWMIHNFVNATMKEFWSFADVGFQKFKDNVK